MISPFTKPGTKVVCIKTASKSWNYYTGERTSRAFPLAVGEVYEVSEVVKSSIVANGFAVGLRGYTHCFQLHLFRYAELPRSITQYLDDVKSPITEREHV